MLTNFHLGLAQFGTFTLQLKKIPIYKVIFFSSTTWLEKVQFSSSLDKSLYKFRLDVSLCVQYVSLCQTFSELTNLYSQWENRVDRLSESLHRMFPQVIPVLEFRCCSKQREMCVLNCIKLFFTYNGPTLAKCVLKMLAINSVIWF